MPGTDAVPYVRARTPGVVDHPRAPAVRAESCCAETCVYLFSAARWSWLKPLGQKHSPQCGECFCEAA